MKKILACLLVLGVAIGMTTAACRSENTSRENSRIDLAAQLSPLEEEEKARIGVYGIDTGTGKIVSYRDKERFAYCSTIKVLLAGEILRKYSLEELEYKVSYSQDDLLSYAPVTKKHVAEGMSLENLCSAAIRYSDNTAANLLVRELGGLEVFQQSLKNFGDSVTLPQREEPDLNAAVPGENADTTTPYQMAQDFKGYTLGDFLPPDRREHLVQWMTGNALTDSLIRSVVPKTWTVADKSGSGGYGTRNDAALIKRPGGSPIILVIFTTHDRPDAPSHDELVAKAARIALSSLVPGYMD